MEQVEGCYGCRMLARRAADAQATIAALQARVQELEQWVQDQSTANLETMRHMDEMQSRAMEAEQQLTQRTAELEAVTRERDEAAKDRDDWITSWRALQRYNERIEAELERVRGERDRIVEIVGCSKAYLIETLRAVMQVYHEHHQRMEG